MARFTSILLLVALFYFHQSSASITWSICSPGSPVSVQNVTMDPDPAVSGQPFSLNLPAIASSDISSGTVIVTVTYKNIPVHIEKDDLCSKTECPVPSGNFLFKNSQVLPSVTPAGVYKVKLNALDTNNEVLFCANIQFQVVKSSKITEKGEENNNNDGDDETENEGLNIMNYSKKLKDRKLHLL